jgi:hypothetical protein
MKALQNRCLWERRSRRRPLDGPSPTDVVPAAALAAIAGVTIASLFASFFRASAAERDPARGREVAPGG